jgi:DNA-binding NtrC family response regulator
MPEMNGLELVKQVRRRYPRLPVILMTAFGSEDIAVEALRSGAISYVPKKDLKQYLGEALRQVQAAVESVMQRDQVRQILISSDTRFVFGY